MKTLDDIFDGDSYEEDIQLHTDEVLQIIQSTTKKLFNQLQIHPK